LNASELSIDQSVMNETEGIWLMHPLSGVDWSVLFDFSCANQRCFLGVGVLGPLDAGAAGDATVLIGRCSAEDADS